jgi:sugar/nucleoside kinase (ribokinase family)
VSADERGLGLVVIGDAHVALSAADALESAASFRKTLGGDTLLTAIVAARAGLEVALVTRVGDDDFSDWMLQSFEREGLHLDYTRQVAGPNALLLLGAGRDGRQAARYVGAGSAVALEPADLVDVPWDMVRVTFVAGSFQALGPSERRTAIASFAAARAAGVRTIYDPALTVGMWARDEGGAARAAFDAMLPHTDLLVVGAPYASGKLLGRPAPVEAAREAIGRGVSAVVVRHGDGSVVVGDGKSTETLAARDAAASHGDPTRPAIFDGTLITALARGVALVDAVDLAMLADAATPHGPRDLEGLPARHQLRAWLASP